MAQMPEVLRRFRLDGKTAVVTGVGIGMGAHIAKAFSEVGANVVVSARTTDVIQEAARSIEKSGGAALPVQADVGKQSDRERLIAAAQDKFGAIDILYNNAGGGRFPKSESSLGVPDEFWQECIQVNLMAPARLAELVVPGMKRKGHGVIINVLTGLAFQPLSSFGPYASSKAGLHALTRYLAKECGPEIRVNAVCPGTVSWDGQIRPWWKPLLETVPMKRAGSPDDAIGTALFLASEASSYITGQVIFVDGGRLACRG